jgi:hypothetical protein
MSLIEKGDANFRLSVRFRKKIVLIERVSRPAAVDFSAAGLNVSNADLSKPDPALFAKDFIHEHTLPDASSSAAVTPGNRVIVSIRTQTHPVPKSAQA